jgi:hypothetical protein
VLVIRAWLEPGRRDGFRARLIGADPDDPSSSVAVSSRAEVLDVVALWLSVLVADGSR